MRARYGATGSVEPAREGLKSRFHGHLELGLDYLLKDQIYLEFGGRYEDAEGPESEDKFSFSVGLRNQF